MLNIIKTLEYYINELFCYTSCFIQKCLTAPDQSESLIPEDTILSSV